MITYRTSYILIHQISPPLGLRNNMVGCVYFKTCTGYNVISNMIFFIID